MSDLVDQFIRLKPIAKAGILAGILAALAGGDYLLFFSDILDEQQKNRVLIQQAKDEKEQYEKRKREYQSFRLEVNQLLEEQKALLQVLPKRDDIEQFIESVNAQVELSGLSKVSSVRSPAVPEELYLRIPIKMSLAGSYHQINRFFKNVGELRRIVTISDLQLAPAGVGMPARESVTLKADFVAQTFQFLEKGATAVQAPGGKR